MYTLLLRLIAPLQSWGVQSRFSVRDTGLEPSKSGVVGLLCAALGWPRTTPLDVFIKQRMGVRIDCEGSLSVDYHIAQDVLKSAGGIKVAEPSRRYYLAGARFLVGVEDKDDHFLQRLNESLQHPIWPLYLGRKAFVPTYPIWLPDGLRLNETLEEALQKYPYLGRSDESDKPDYLRLVLEDDGGPEVRPDQPISFAERHYLVRRVCTTYVACPRLAMEV